MGRALSGTGAPPATVKREVLLATAHLQYVRLSNNYPFVTAVVIRFSVLNSNIEDVCHMTFLQNLSTSTQLYLYVVN